MRDGLFITLEGGEGSGKSLAIKGLKKHFEAQGIEVLITREPGGLEVAEKIRNIVVEEEMDPITEAYLFAASRNELVKNVIQPALEKKMVVICDRFVDSSFVYQGHVKGIGIDKVVDINKYAMNGYLPDITLYFDVDPAIGLERIASNNREVNKFDKQDLSFHHKVREGYRLIQKKYKHRIKQIDASQSKEAVLSQCVKEVDWYRETYEL